MEKNFLGKKSMGIKRATFLVGGDGMVLKVFNSVDVKVHSKEILDFFKMQK